MPPKGLQPNRAVRRAEGSNKPVYRVTTEPAPPRELVLQCVHEFMEAIYTGEAISYREPTFRCSAFPYCPLIMATSLPYLGAAYRSDFYFGVGTALHDLIQRWASRISVTPELWGNWKCAGCGAKRVHCVRPHECEACANDLNVPYYEWQYVEVELLWNGLSGHVDTILKIGPYYIVVDYKTTEFKTLGSAADRNRYPYLANVVQIEIYCTLLHEVLGLDILNWNLIYVHRGKPIRSKNDYHTILGPDWTEARHARMLNILRWAARCDPLATKIRLALIAGETIPLESIQQLVDERPCKSMTQWEAWMAPKFYWEKSENDPDAPGECQHLIHCTNDTPEALDTYWLEVFNGAG